MGSEKGNISCTLDYFDYVLGYFLVSHFNSKSICESATVSLAVTRIQNYVIASALKYLMTLRNESKGQLSRKHSWLLSWKEAEGSSK